MDLTENTCNRSFYNKTPILPSSQMCPLSQEAEKWGGLGNEISGTGDRKTMPPANCNGTFASNGSIDARSTSDTASEDIVSVLFLHPFTFLLPYVKIIIL